MLLNKEPLAKLTEFNGLWARGEVSTCPPDHLTACDNCTFPGKSQVSIRERLTIQNFLPAHNIISYFIAQTPNGPILITLASDGTLTDESLGRVLGSFAGADDIAAINIFGRTYLCLKAKGKSFFNALYRYDLTLGLVAAGGSGPVSGPTLAQPNAGYVDIGNHKFAISYETITGYLSPPSPLATINSDGSHSVSLTNIPVGPAGTVARVVLATKANELEFFFVPGGRIGDNSTTTFEYNQYDTSLVSSAGYLNDILAEIPGAAALKFYKGRLVLIGATNYPDNILVSDINSPESFNLVNNVIHIPVDYGVNTSAGGMVIRDVLYITKPNATYATQDNGREPGTWGVTVIDSGLGAFDVGISSFASSMSSQDVLDSCLIAHKRGLLFFNGAYSDVPLSWKIDRIWEVMDSNNFSKVQVAHDSWLKRVYIAVPLVKDVDLEAVQSSNNKMILMMDYKDGLNPRSVKWSIWYFGGVNVAFKDIYKISMENFTLTYSNWPMIFQLSIATGETGIYKCIGPYADPQGQPQPPDSFMDGSYSAIIQAIKTAPVIPGNGIYTFLRFMIHVDSGYSRLSLLALAHNKNIPNADVNATQSSGTASSGTVILGKCNFTWDGVRLYVTCDVTKPNNYNGYFSLSSVSIYGNLMWKERPA